MKEWLAENGMETDTLGKKAVAELLKTAPPLLADVLTLRQQLAKSSVKKYSAMETAVCPDGRARSRAHYPASESSAESYPGLGGSAGTCEKR